MRSECVVNGDEYGDESDVLATREVAPPPTQGVPIVGSACASLWCALPSTALASLMMHCAESDLAASGEFGELLNVVWSASAMGAAFAASHFDDSSFVYSCSWAAVMARRLSDRRRLSSGGIELTQFNRGKTGARGSSLSSENEIGCTTVAFGLPPTGHCSYALVLKVVPAEDGDQPEQRQEPHDRDHHQRSSLRTSPDILQWSRHRPVAVEAAGV